MVCATRVKRGSTLAKIKSADLGQAKFRRRVVLRVHEVLVEIPNGMSMLPDGLQRLDPAPVSATSTRSDKQLPLVGAACYCTRDAAHCIIDIIKNRATMMSLPLALSPGLLGST
jgi:hypothetical protein